MYLKNSKFATFLQELMRKRNKLPTQFAADIGVSHVTMSRWLKGTDKPNSKSCSKLAEYSGISVETIFAMLDYLPQKKQLPFPEWPEFREYASNKYPDELDEDIISLIEDLIERRRTKNFGHKGPFLGK